jgi:hypothetical protein
MIDTLFSVSAFQNALVSSTTPMIYLPYPKKNQQPAGEKIKLRSSTIQDQHHQKAAF